MATYDVEIYLWQSIDKRTNSTMRPHGVPYYDGKCALFEPLNILSPQLIFGPEKIAGTDDYYVFESTKYCRIPSLNRYYWITGWTRQDGLWYATTALDVLATYQPEIYDSTQYILRSTKAPDYYIPDTFYPYSLQNIVIEEKTGIQITGTNYKWETLKNATPSETKKNVYVNFASVGYLKQGITDPGPDDLNEPSITYAIPHNRLDDLWFRVQSEDTENVKMINYIKRIYLLPIAPYTPYDSKDSSGVVSGGIVYGDYDNVYSSLQKVEPTKYKQTWATFPYLALPGSEPTLETLAFLKALDFIPIKDNRVATVSWSIPFPDDWLENDKPYLLSNSYCKLFIKFQPFGTVEIDPNQFLGEKSIRVKCEISLSTGDATLFVWKHQKSFVPIATTNVSISVQLNATQNNDTQYIRNQISGVTSLASSALSIAAGIDRFNTATFAPTITYGPTGAATRPGDFVGGISAQEAGGYFKQGLREEAAAKELGSNIAGTSGGIINSLMMMSIPPQTSCQINGQPGDCQMDDAPALIYQRYELVETDIDKFGAMTMATKKLSDLHGGFVMTKDAKLPTTTNMLVGEQTQIENFLNGGIYLEE